MHRDVNAPLTSACGTDGRMSGREACSGLVATRTGSIALDAHARPGPGGAGACRPRPSPCPQRRGQGWAGIRGRGGTERRPEGKGKRKKRGPGRDPDYGLQASRARRMFPLTVRRGAARWLGAPQAAPGAGRLSGTVSPFRAEQGTSLETPSPGKSGLHARGEGERVLAPSHGRGLGPRDALKKDSRGLPRGAAGNPRVPRLLPGTLGNFPGCL